MGGKPRFTPEEREALITLCRAEDGRFDEIVGGCTPGKMVDQWARFIRAVDRARKKLEDS